MPNARRRSIAAPSIGAGQQNGTMHLIHRVSQCASDLFAKSGAPTELTPRQCVVLNVIADNSGLSQADIVDRTGIDRSTLADLIRRLEARGLVDRKRKKTDARAYALVLTSAGRLAHQQALPAARQVDKSILAVLPKEQRSQFKQSLTTILANLK